jgi:hypothetical protein
VEQGNLRQNSRSNPEAQSQKPTLEIMALLQANKELSKQVSDENNKLAITTQ